MFQTLKWGVFFAAREAKNEMFQTLKMANVPIAKQNVPIAKSNVPIAK
jgi:hypothetical protein